MTRVSVPVPGPLTGAAPRLAEVAPGVFVATSAFWSTNTTVVAAEDGSALLVDPGVLPHELAALAGELAARGLTVTAGMCTHAHWDHVLWPPDLSPVTRWASTGTVELLARHRDELVERPLAEQGAARGERWARPDLDLAPLADGEIVPWDGPGAAILVADAHVGGHTSLLVAERRLLVAGDLLSDVDVPFPAFEPVGEVVDPVAAYRRGLDRLAAELAEGTVDLVIPGHGSPTDVTGARRRLEADRRYLDLLVSATAEPASPDAARHRADAIDDPRLADPAVRRAHRASVAALLAARRADVRPR